MHKRRTFGAAVIMAVTLLGATPVTASAAPSKCGSYASQSDLHAWGWCDGGTGQFRVVANCVGRDQWGNEFGLWQPGPWTTTGPSRYSNAWCGSDDFYIIRGTWIETR